MIKKNSSGVEKQRLEANMSKINKLAYLVHLQIILIKQSTVSGRKTDKVLSVLKNDGLV